MTLNLLSLVWPIHRVPFFCGIAWCGAVSTIALAGCAEQPAVPAVSPVPGYPSFGSPSPVAGSWQQFCEQVSSVPQANSLVAARGIDGWELVAMYNGVLCYKRPTYRALPPPTAPTYIPEPQLAHPYVSPYYHRDVRDPGF